MSNWPHISRYSTIRSHTHTHIYEYTHICMYVCTYLHLRFSEFWVFLSKKFRFVLLNVYYYTFSYGFFTFFSNTRTLANILFRIRTPVTQAAPVTYKFIATIETQDIRTVIAVKTHFSRSALHDRCFFTTFYTLSSFTFFSIL